MQTRTVFAFSAVLLVGLTFLQPGRSIDSVGASETTQKAGRQLSERKIFMRQKLRMVNSIVEGLTTEDYGLVTQGCN